LRPARYATPPLGPVPRARSPASPADRPTPPSRLSFNLAQRLRSARRDPRRNHRGFPSPTAPAIPGLPALNAQAAPPWKPYPPPPRRSAPSRQAPPRKALRRRESITPLHPSPSQPPRELRPVLKIHPDLACPGPSHACARFSTRDSQPVSCSAVAIPHRPSTSDRPDYRGFLADTPGAELRSPGARRRPPSTHPRAPPRTAAGSRR